LTISLAYTLGQWGERQLTIYKATIDEALETICRTPEIGRDVDGMPGVRIYPADKACDFLPDWKARYPGTQDIARTHGRHQPSMRHHYLPTPPAAPTAKSP